MECVCEMTTEPFPLEYLTGWDQATLLGTYYLDQCNPNIWSGGTAWFPDCAVIGAACTLGYVHCDYPLTGTTATTPYTVHVAGGGSSPYSFFGTDPLTIHSPNELQTFAFTSFNNLAGFELIDRSWTEASYTNSTGQWFLPGGISFTTTTIYTSTTLLETNATVWNLEVAIRSGDQPICQYSQTGPVLYENCCKLEPWGRLTAGAVIREWEKEDRNREAIRTRRKRGRGPCNDPNHDAKLAEAWISSGAQSYAKSLETLTRRFPTLTEDELRHAVDRHRHQPRR
jgi:hypothetical protein